MEQEKKKGKNCVWPHPRVDFHLGRQKSAGKGKNQVPNSRKSPPVYH